MMHHINWVEHTGIMIDMQKKLLHSENNFCDVRLVTSSGKMFYAHKAILFSTCDLFKTILKEVPETPDICTILIPEIEDSVLQNIIDFVYVGTITLSSNNLTEFLETMNLLGIKSAISFECNQIKTNKNEHVKYKETIVVDEDDDINMDKSMIEEDDEEEDVDTVDASGSNDKTIQFLEVFNETEVCELNQYAIDNSIEENGSGDYILTENPDNSFILSEQKMEASPQISINRVKEKKSKIEKRKQSSNFQITPIEVNKIDSNATQNRDQAFEFAEHAVIDEGISLQKAAEKFQISKTVLWRRVRKNPSYNKTYRENPTVEAAIQKLEKGESLKSVSQELGIPMSTLHRHKMRLAEEGRLPEHIQIKRRDLESKEILKNKLNKAVVACIDGMSQNHAAAVFEVPKSTLWRHLQKRNFYSNKMHLVKDEPDDNVTKTIVSKSELPESGFSN